MRQPKNILAIAAALLFLWACGNTVDAGGGVSLAQMNQAIAAAVKPLQEEINTLQSELPHNLIVSHGGISSGRTFALRTISSAPGAATIVAPTAILATFLGTPNGSIFGMTQQIGISNATNYLFVAQADGTSVNSAGMPVTILYEGPNCTGVPFTVLGVGISTANVTQGIVFGTGPVGDTVASDYLMLKAGEQTKPDFANSELEAIPGAPTCVNITPGPNNFDATYPLVQNDPAVSGIPSGPFAATSLGP